MFILHEVLLSINILSVQLQAKGTTLGKSGNLVKGVIRTLENNRSDEHFSELWSEIKIFCLENDISIDNSHQGNTNLAIHTTYILYIYLIYFHYAHRSKEA